MLLVINWGCWLRLSRGAGCNGRFRWSCGWLGRRRMRRHDWQTLLIKACQTWKSPSSFCGATLKRGERVNWCLHEALYIPQRRRESHEGVEDGERTTTPRAGRERQYFYSSRNRSAPVGYEQRSGSSWPMAALRNPNTQNRPCSAQVACIGTSPICPVRDMGVRKSLRQPLLCRRWE